MEFLLFPSDRLGRVHRFVAPLALFTPAAELRSQSVGGAASSASLALLGLLLGVPALLKALGAEKLGFFLALLLKLGGDGGRHLLAAGAAREARGVVLLLLERKGLGRVHGLVANLALVATAAELGGAAARALLLRPLDVALLLRVVWGGEGGIKGSCRRATRKR